MLDWEGGFDMIFDRGLIQHSLQFHKILRITPARNVVMWLATYLDKFWRSES